MNDGLLCHICPLQDEDVAWSDIDGVQKTDVDAIIDWKRAQRGTFNGNVI